MPKQLVCQNREESAVGRVAINQQTSQTRQTPTTTNSKPATHRLGSFAFQPYQLFNPTPYAAKHKLVDGCDDVISNGSNHSKSSDSKELPINLMMMTNKNAKVDRMSICSDVSSSDNETTRQPSNNIKSLSPPSLATVQKNCHPPTVTTHVPSPVTTHHLGSTPSFGQPNTVVPQIKLPPTSMYPYTKQQTPIDNISPPTIIQPLPPIPSINSMRSLVGLSPKVQKQGFASPKVKAKKGLSAHLTTNNFSAVVNSGSTKSFGSSTSTTQNFYASPMKSVDNSNPYTISSLTTQSTQNENVNQTNIINPNQTPEKKEAPLAVKPIPKLPFGTLSLMN